MTKDTKAPIYVVSKGRYDVNMTARVRHHHKIDYTDFKNLYLIKDDFELPEDHEFGMVLRKIN